MWSLLQVAGTAAGAPNLPAPPMRMRVQSFLILVVVASSAGAQDRDRGTLLFQAGNWEAARTEFSRMVDLNSRDAHAHYYLARLGLLSDEPDVAADHLAQAIDIDPTTSEYHFAYCRALGLQALRASKFKQPFLARHMRSECERAVELDSNNIDARDRLVDFYVRAPGFMGGGVSKALEQSDAIARVSAMRGRLSAARIAIQQEDAGHAQRELEAAITFAPDSLRPYLALASWHIQQKIWSQAFASIDRYLRQHPDDVYAKYALGRIAAASGQELARGEQGIRLFLAKPPADSGTATLSTAYVQLARVLEHQGRHVDAQGARDRAAALNPRNEEARLER